MGRDVFDVMGDMIKKTKPKKSTWKPTQGVSIVRPLMFVDGDGDEQLFVPEYTHFIDGPGGKKEAIKCDGPNSDCPICALEEYCTKDEWNKFKPNLKWYVNLIVREDPDGNENMFTVGQLSNGCFKNFIKHIHGPTAQKDALDPERGLDFSIQRTAASDWRDIRYNVTPIVDRCPIGMDVKCQDITKWFASAPMDQLENMAGKIQALLKV